MQMQATENSSYPRKIDFNLAPYLLIGIPKEQLFDNQWIYLMAHVGVI